MIKVLTRTIRPDHMLALENLAAPGREPNWWQDLLRAWAPAGSPLTNHRPLRLAVRNGYLNFYSNGQSVAKVSFERGGTPRLETHVKYVSSDTKGQRYASLVGQTVQFKEGGRARELPYLGKSTLTEWAVRANGYAGFEKKGVECVIAANPNIVDLEMGIPAWPEQATDASTPERTTKFAPRMDVVALESSDEGRVRAVFWEAKTLRDGRLRSSRDSPEALAQLQLYKNYLAREAYRTAVAKAYRDSCRILVKLHRIAAAVDGEDNLPSLGNLILSVASGSEVPTVDTEPRLLVFPAAREKGFDAEPKGWNIHFTRLTKSVPVLYEQDPRAVVLDDKKLERYRVSPAHNVMEPV
jgi:hypothetical protein